MKKVFLLLSAILVAGFLHVFAGDQLASEPEPSLTLHAKDSVETVLPTIGGILGAIRCDSKGDLYLQSESRTLLRVSADGSRVVGYDFTGFPEPTANSEFLSRVRSGLGPLDVTDFALAPGGGLYVPIGFGGTAHVLRFGSDGRYESKTKLDAPEFFRPTDLAVFANGNYLVYGEVQRPKKDKPSRPYAAIFDSSGQLVKQLSLDSDDKIAGQSERNNEKLSQAAGGNAVTSSDGNAYMMRRLKNPFVYVISPSGELVRILKIASPQGFTPMAMSTAGGQLIFTFQNNAKKPVRIIYIIYDSYDGRELARYTRGEDLKGIFACYANNEFTFLVKRDGKRVIVDAAP